VLFHACVNAHPSKNDPLISLGERLKRKLTPPDPLEPFDPAIRTWFGASFAAPTAAQVQGWPAITRGDSTLIFAPTGSGKTLTAFLWSIHQVMFSPLPPKDRRCRVLYISPLKALAVDVERNLRAPLAGITNVAVAAQREFVLPSIAIRTGDTPSIERARFQREPADILITTPESLYLLLTSNAREALRSIETVIIDEIHAMVPTKRGSHLALSLERLDMICETPPQRIGLSATQRPLEEVARFLGGFERRPVRTRKPDGKAIEAGASEIENEFVDHNKAPTPRAVTIVDTGERKKLELRVEVPVEDMARLGEPIDIPSGQASQGPLRASIWPALHPRLLELIRTHKSTLIFVNSRRLAERLAAALNELAGEPIVSAHHGSIARAQRVEIEDNLKSGRIPALVATSSLELGIDMGAIDLVIQIEAPPSIASGMQRIGRASHQVGAVSKGFVFPKFRGDLVACAALTDSMRTGKIEATRYPRNPLDILAQHIVAMVAMDAWNADELFAVVRSSAPFAELSRAVFDGVLDMLSGLYPSDEFAELKPRITWDRIENTIVARTGAKRVAIINGGTIPDRGLYGVFLAGAESKSARVGELDEEMVFESRVGETFLLGASTWRIEEITHDRVLVSPAPGQPGKMPFWHGDSADRNVEFGMRIGSLVRELRTLTHARAVQKLEKEHDLDVRAAENLLQYLDEQHAAADAVPDDRTILIERCLDELGDWRVCVLTPFGGRVHAPWAMAVTAKVRNELGIEVETMWADDGFVVRFPETETPPDPSLLIPSVDEVEDLVVRQLGSSALFAAKFRESAARALLLPRRRAGVRAPLWQQRKRAADLLQVASRFGSFPMLLETYRECLRDVFDLPSLVTLMRQLESREVRVATVTTEKPSPFAASLLFRYVANYIYDGDAPLAERRAQALSIDQAQLRDLLGQIELRDLLDADAIDTVERQLQHLDEKYRVRHTDGLHDLLIRIGDLSAAEIAARTVDAGVADSIQTLARDRRALEVMIAGQRRYIAIEDAGRYRDALGIPLPTGIAERLLVSVADPFGDLLLRYARTHGPFTLSSIAQRFGLGPKIVESHLQRLTEKGRLIEGEFRPGGSQREWCESDVLRSIRSKSLARLRHEVEPVPQTALVRLMTSWQGVTRKRRGLNALLEVMETLQGVPLPASIFEREILASRMEDYRASDLDILTSAGEIVWVGLEPLGERDGRIAFFLTDHLPLLLQPKKSDDLTELEEKIVAALRRAGASFFSAIHAAAGGGFPGDTLDGLWKLVWNGIVTNDTFQALRSLTRPRTNRSGRASTPFRSRRAVPPGSEGRWSLVEHLASGTPDPTRRGLGLTNQLLARYGVLTREALNGEMITGGFSAVYDVLKTLEESGKVRRGFFVAGLAATQFALPGAVDLLRSMKDDPETPETVVLAASDPANPYGTILRWPEEGGRLSRAVGAAVILVNGRLAAHVSRGEKHFSIFLPEDEPNRSVIAQEVARTLADYVRNGKRRAMLISEINFDPVDESPIAPFLLDQGFVRTSMGYQLRALVQTERSVLGMR